MEDNVATQHRAAPARRHEPTVATAPQSRTRGAARERTAFLSLRTASVFRIGIDKSKVSGNKAKASAIRLAKVVKIDPKAYAAKVAAAGNEAFVLAIVLRMDAADLPIGSTDPRHPRGAFHPHEPDARSDTRFRPTHHRYRRRGTKDDVDKSGGAVVAGDQVGLSGLQQRYDAQLRGTPGVRVRLVAAKPSGSSASPSPTPSPAAEATPIVLFEVKPVPGKPLTTTLNVGLQKLAEKTLARTKPASALVAIRPSTGAIVAAANGEGNRGQSLATVGRAAPGSTFKVVSALALLRAGLTPESSIKCPLTVTVNGRKFSNYSDYPRNHLGTIPFQTALAQSCNTAFIGQRGKLKGSALADAAGSLGVGIDYDVGFPSFFGSVPRRSDPHRPRRCHDRSGQDRGLTDGYGWRGGIGRGRRDSDTAPDRRNPGHLEGKAADQ